MHTFVIRKAIIINFWFYFSLALMSLSMGSVQAQTFANCGDVAQDPCQVSTWAELNEIRNALAKRYVLMNDLDQTTVGYDLFAAPTANNGQGWLPIGVWQSEFVGTFDGGGHTIADLHINPLLASNDEAILGLFGFVGEPTGPKQGEIKNLNLSALNYTIACDPSDPFFNQITLGGVVGFKQQSVDAINLSASGSMTVDLADCNFFFPQVEVGGLIGYNRGSLSVGRANVAIDVFNGPSTNQEFMLVGGVVGFNQGTVDRVSSEASVRGPVVGGLIGFNDAILFDSYSVAAVTSWVMAGGLIGSNQGNTVSRLYAAGTLTMIGSGQSAAIIADPIVTPTTVAGVFWNGDIIGQTDAVVGASLTQTQMRTQSSFTGLDFSETGAWVIVTDGARSYPYLRALTYDAIGTSPSVYPIPGLELACEPGQFSSTGYGTCQPCPAGQIAPLPAATQCTLCPKGFFQESTGQMTCLQCGVGETTSGPGALACVSNLLFKDRFQVLPP